MEIRKVKTVYGGVVHVLEADLAKARNLVPLCNRLGAYVLDKRGNRVLCALGNLLLDEPSRPVVCEFTTFPDGSRYRSYRYADQESVTC